MTSSSYRDLIVWQKAMDLVERVYKESRHFPKEELYGLTSQVRRAAVSIPSNIAEGQGQASRKGFLHFLHIAKGSIKELETQLIIAGRLGYIQNSDLSPLLHDTEEIGKILTGLQRSLSSS